MKFMEFIGGNNYRIIDLDKIERFYLQEGTSRSVIIHMDSGYEMSNMFATRQDAEAVVNFLKRQLNVLTVTVEEGNVSVSTVDNM